eukprot:gene9582-1784_t
MKFFFLPQTYLQLGCVVAVSTLFGAILNQVLSNSDEHEKKIIEENSTQEVQLEKISEPLKMMLLVRKDLKMEVGKIAAQCGHGVLGVYRDIQKKKNKIHLHYVKEWIRIGQKKIAVKIPDLETLKSSSKLAQELNIPFHIVVDAGKTVVAPNTMTVLAIGPALESQINKITKGFKLL